MLVLVPTVIVTATVMIILFFESSSVGEKIPEALARGFLKSRYILTRGQEKGDTDFYYDIDLGVTDPYLLKRLADWYIRTLKEINIESFAIDKIAFFEKDSGPVGAILLTGLIVQETGIPAVLVRLRRRLLETSFKGLDSIKEGDVIALISDFQPQAEDLRRQQKKSRLKEPRCR